jgi:hypothetical protein
MPPFNASHQYDAFDRVEDVTITSLTLRGGENRGATKVANRSCDGGHEQANSHTPTRLHSSTWSRATYIVSWAYYFVLSEI